MQTRTLWTRCAIIAVCVVETLLTGLVVGGLNLICTLTAANGYGFFIVLRVEV